jgi:hypothetical protein
MREVVELLSVDAVPDADGAERLRLNADVGQFDGRLQRADGDAAVLWVFGAGGGLGGPAGGLYARLGRQLSRRGVTSLELDYRRPGDLHDCVIDVVLALGLLDHLGKSRVVLVGHSFGGAVVISAGVMSEMVVAVAALSSQTFGADDVSDLAPRPVLFAHGGDDEVLPVACSHRLYAEAREPKQLIVYPGCRHGLDECRESLDADLTAWLERVLDLPRERPARLDA